MPFPSMLLSPGPTTWPGGDAPEPTPGLGLVWDAPTDRYFHHGVDRGVLYPTDGDPVVWNGITGMDESGGGDSAVYYVDGNIYMADVEPGDFNGSLTAYSWPEAFSRCMGVPQAADGLYIDNQKPRRFHLSYRSLIGSGLDGDMFGYQIHLVYKAIASVGARQRKTMAQTPEPMEWNFDMVCTPMALPGFRPSAHYILDTRYISDANLVELEHILYGDGVTAGRMPDPIELYDMLSFGDAITFVDHGDGTWTGTGSFENVHWLDADTWEILNVNGTDLGDGEYTLEDTP